MSLISISEAAELTGQSIPTIYHDIKEGKLTKTDNKIETKDLLRLYGASKTFTDFRRENELLTRLNADLKHDKEKLYQINELLRCSNTDLQQDKEKLYRIIASQQKGQSAKAVNPKSNEVLAPDTTSTDKSLTQRLVRKLFFK